MIYSEPVPPATVSLINLSLSYYMYVHSSVQQYITTVYTIMIVLNVSKTSVDRSATAVHVKLYNKLTSVYQR